MLGFFRGAQDAHGRPRAKKTRLIPQGEGLEDRRLLSGNGTNYTLMGGSWSNPDRITFSFAPDGVSWDRGINDINARMDVQYGGKAWQDIIARSLQTWAVSANLDFVRVNDGAYGFNWTGSSQNDPKFGDIRIGGYSFPESATLARTYGPPPNGTTGSGDSEVNTAYTFGAGAQYDLGTIMMHELGHSLGLGESPQGQAVMYQYYGGIKTSLTPYDIEGIQSLYGPRQPDIYRAVGLGNNLATAIDLTASLGTSRQAYLTNLSLNSIGDTEFFSVVAPTTGSSLVVTAQAAGISLLSPKVVVLDASGNAIAVNAQASTYGNDIQVAIPDVVAGQRYTIAVQGATNDVFSVGTYALAVAFSGGQVANPTPAPTPPPAPIPIPVPPPVPPVNPTPIVTPIPADRFEPNNTPATATNLGVLGQTVVNGLSFSSAMDSDVFTFTTSGSGVIMIASEGAQIIVTNEAGQTVVAGTGLIGFASPVAGARYYLTFVSSTGQPTANYGFSLVENLTPKPATPTPIANPTPIPAIPRTKAEKAAAAKAARKAAQLAAAQAAARRRAARKLAMAIKAGLAANSND